MQKSYSKNYIKIYFYQIISIFLGFASLFVVVPFLSVDKSTYGIYTICISTTVFLSYADLGFLGAGMKYAAEFFAKGDRENEIKITGFVHFILLVLLLLFSGFFLVLSFYPNLLINNIEKENSVSIAQSLFLILALFTPIIFLQRILQTIFGIRLQEFILQRINILGNLVKILSVFWFFGFGNYDIVSYFLFTQIVNLCCVIFGVLKARKVFNYNFILLFRSCKFSRAMFLKTKFLAFSGLFVTVSWILYYELDSFAIGKILGANKVAVYAIGFTILSFYRSLLGVFFSPFSARFNHFTGVNKTKELQAFYSHILLFSFPIVVFPIIAVVIFSRPIVVSWVGVEYVESIEIVKWLVSCNLLAFISYPAGILLVAQEKIKLNYFIGLMMPVIYWLGIYFTIGIFGVTSFAIFKFVVFLISGIFYLRFSLRFLNITFFQFLNQYIIRFIPSIFLLIFGLLHFENFYVEGKDKTNLLLNIIIMTILLVFSSTLCFIFVKQFREYGFKIIKIISRHEI